MNVSRANPALSARPGDCRRLSTTRSAVAHCQRCSPAAVAAAICRAQHSSALPALFSDCPAQLIKPNRTVECQWLQALIRGRGAAQDNTRTDMQPDCLIEQGLVVRIGIERHAHLGLGLRWGLVPPSSASCQNTHRRRYHPYRLRHW